MARRGNFVIGVVEVREFAMAFEFKDCIVDDVNS